MTVAPIVTYERAARIPTDHLHIYLNRILKEIVKSLYRVVKDDLLAKELFFDCYADTDEFNVVTGDTIIVGYIRISSGRIK